MTTTHYALIGIGISIVSLVAIVGGMWWYRRDYSKEEYLWDLMIDAVDIKKEMR